MFSRKCELIPTASASRRRFSLVTIMPFGRAHNVTDAVVHSEEEDSNFGAFRFETLPVPGDRIRVGDIRGAPGILVVLYVEHHPVMLPVPATANQDPSVSICARFIQDLSGTDAARLLLAPTQPLRGEDGAKRA
jgi:hypothetical protein